MKVREKPDAVNKTVAVFLWTYCIGFVAVYLSVPNPLVFQVNIQFPSQSLQHKCLHFSGQALYGTVVFVMIGQAVITIRIQNNPQVMSLYTASVLFYLAGFILWNLGNT